MPVYILILWVSNAIAWWLLKHLSGELIPLGINSGPIFYRTSLRSTILGCRDILILLLTPFLFLHNIQGGGKTYLTAREKRYLSGERSLPPPRGLNLSPRSHATQPGSGSQRPENSQVSNWWPDAAGEGNSPCWSDQLSQNRLQGHKGRCLRYRSAAPPHAIPDSGSCETGGWDKLCRRWMNTVVCVACA